MAHFPAKPASVPYCPSSSAKISAPASQIYAAILDTSTWSSWNGFVPNCTITSQPGSESAESTQLQVGTHMTFHCVVFPSMPRITFPQRFVVTEVSEHEGTYVIRWAAMGMPEFIGKTDRVHLVRPLADAECKVATWDAMEGPFAWVVKWTVGGTVQRGIERWVEGLKTWHEKGK